MRLDAFLLCQEVSQSVGSPLINLQGLITGPITVDFSKAPPFLGAPLALPKLWAVAIFSGMTDVRELEFSWELHIGTERLGILPRQKTDRSQPDETHTIANQFAPFLLPRPGKYSFTVTVTIDEETRSFSKVLEVRQTPAANQPPPKIQ